ncbi:ABC transporter permease [Coprococcus catus]|uniref:ABC transporter permease n=1 Tax=Coprococcus catus TaxID=116085 RepID=UPI0020977AB3|nr:ABC transporter permease [Coprococcus catus]MCO7147071.1 ABC transporter permease [Coprococcus catus]
MKILIIELKKEKRYGIILLMFAIGILGAAYAFLNFAVRKDTLLSLPLAPMTILLTQLYGMMMTLNLFGIIVAACMIYSMEFKDCAVKKMYMLPVHVPAMYLCKFLILTILLSVAAALQNLALTQIGITSLPEGTFELYTLIIFALYSLITAMPALSFMLFIASRFENMWISLGIGVAGFLSGMALGVPKIGLFLADPFVIMLKPAVSMSTRPDVSVIAIAIVETLLFLAAGLWTSANIHYE